MRRRQMLIMVSLLMVLLVLTGTLLFAYYRIAHREKAPTAAQEQGARGDSD